MNNLFLALVDGAGKDLGSGGIIAVFSIVLVFLILGLIIAITYVVGLVIQKFAKTEKAEESTTPAAATASAKTVDIPDDDAMAAVLVASVDYRNETKKDVKVISVKEIK